MATTAQLIQLFKDTMKGDLLSDQYQENGTDTVIVAELNDAQRQLSEWCQFTKPSVPISMAIAGGYSRTLDSLNATNRVRKINGLLNPLTKQTFLVKPLWDLSYQTPQWITDTLAGSPYGVWQEGKTVVFYPLPTVAETYYLDCECDAQNLNSATLTVEPELDITLHNHIAYLAAAMVSERNTMTGIQAGIVKNIYAAAESACLSILYKEAVQL